MYRSRAVKVNKVQCWDASAPDFPELWEQEYSQEQRRHRQRGPMTATGALLFMPLLTDVLILWLTVVGFPRMLSL